MKEPLKNFATVGLVHHLFYPSCVHDPQVHADSLEQFIQRRDMATFDVSMPWDNALRHRLIPKIRASSERLHDTAYAIHLFPARQICLGTTNKQQQDLIKMILLDQIDIAMAIGARQFIFMSGIDVPQEERPQAIQCFKTLCRWLCEQLHNHDMIATLEIFDRHVDKKFLCGPSEEAVQLIQALKTDVDNIGLLLDVAHIRLLNESLEQTIRRCAPYLNRVHLGNCVIKNKENPYYGDLHPPIGYTDGEIDIPELVETLSTLLETGYLKRGGRNSILTELQPVPGKTLDEWIEDNHRRIETAWGMVQES